MSSLQYFNDPGYGQHLSDTTHYSQAVRIPGIPGQPNVIKISGQGGWDSTGAFSPATTPASIKTHFDQAFRNVDIVLRTAGSEIGWGGVYRVLMFYVKHPEQGVLMPIAECLREWCPNHRPVLTAIPVERLAVEGMLVEVEVEGYDRLPEA